MKRVFHKVLLILWWLETRNNWSSWKTGRMVFHPLLYFCTILLCFALCPVAFNFLKCFCFDVVPLQVHYQTLKKPLRQKRVGGSHCFWLAVNFNQVTKSFGFFKVLQNEKEEEKEEKRSSYFCGRPVTKKNKYNANTDCPSVLWYHSLLPCSFGNKRWRHKSPRVGIFLFFLRLSVWVNPIAVFQWSHLLCHSSSHLLLSQLSQLLFHVQSLPLLMLMHIVAPSVKSLLLPSNQL